MKLKKSKSTDLIIIKDVLVNNSLQKFVSRKLIHICEHRRHLQNWTQRRSLQSQGQVMEQLESHHVCHFGRHDSSNLHVVVVHEIDPAIEASKKIGDVNINPRQLPIGIVPCVLDSGCIRPKHFGTNIIDDIGKQAALHVGGVRQIWCNWCICVVHLGVRDVELNINHSEFTDVSSIQ